MGNDTIPSVQIRVINPIVIEPLMVLPKSEKKVLAVGTFPAEFWDIFPDLKWHRYNYSSFTEELKSNSYDFAIVGGCADQSLKLDITGTEIPVICYQSSALSDRNVVNYHNNRKLTLDPVRVTEKIRTEPVGTPLSSHDPSYSRYTNRFWVLQSYSGSDILEKEGNILFCNGWVLPQYLVREGLLEV